MNKHTSVLNKKAANDFSLTQDSFREFANTEKGKEVLSQISPGEIALTAAGAGIGGLAGYFLAESRTRKPSVLSRVLSTALGATIGGGGAHLLLHAIKDTDTGMSLAQQFRMNKAKGLPELTEAINKSVDSRDPGLFNTTTNLSALAGGAAGYMGSKYVHLPNKASVALEGALISKVAPKLDSIKKYFADKKGYKKQYNATQLQRAEQIRSQAAHRGNVNKVKSIYRGTKGVAKKSIGSAVGYAAALLLSRALSKHPKYE